MVATITILFFAKFFHVVSFPDLGRDTLRKIWPLPLMYLGNMVFGLGGTQQLSLPMMTVLRRFSILMTMAGEYYLLKVRKPAPAPAPAPAIAPAPVLLCSCAPVLLPLLLLQSRPSMAVQMSVYLMIFGSAVAALNDLAFNLRG